MAADGFPMTAANRAPRPAVAATERRARHPVRPPDPAPPLRSETGCHSI